MREVEVSRDLSGQQWYIHQETGEYNGRTFVVSDLILSGCCAKIDSWALMGLLEANHAMKADLLDWKAWREEQDAYS